MRRRSFYRRHCSLPLYIWCAAQNMRWWRWQRWWILLLLLFSTNRKYTAWKQKILFFRMKMCRWIISIFLASNCSVWISAWKNTSWIFITTLLDQHTHTHIMKSTAVTLLQYVVWSVCACVSFGIITLMHGHKKAITISVVKFDRKRRERETEPK